jgi:hypothetical protein
MLAIACGYEDADDLDHVRNDPGFKLACGRLPDSGRDLCSQPTVSRWENAPDLREVVRMTYAMVDLYCASYRRPPAAVTLDIDDTVDVVHGHQQLSLFNALYDERCFLPIHVYDTATARPVAILLRPGKTPSGQEVRGHVRRLVRRIRSHWPATPTAAHPLDMDDAADHLAVPPRLHSAPPARKMRRSADHSESEPSALIERFFCALEVDLTHHRHHATRVGGARRDATCSHAAKGPMLMYAITH